MIVTHLIGGLGNQLFQFACGHAVAELNGAELRVATDGFEGYGLHQGYELAGVFAIDTTVASTDELRALLGPLRHPLVRRSIAKLRPGLWRGGKALFEPPSAALALVQQLGGDAYLHGYWQSEQFFATHGKSLRQGLRFRSAPSAANAALLARIDGCESVSVHLRRGDYISNPKNRAIYAECGADYYCRAISHLLQARPVARLFVFSDDMAWSRQALAEHQGIAEFIDHNRGADSYNDLRLMSQCRHHVIANSSFSWWAAWLGEGQNSASGKIVIAPRRWYVDPERGSDLVPARWLRL